MWQNVQREVTPTNGWNSGESVFSNTTGRNKNYLRKILSISIKIENLCHRK